MVPFLARQHTSKYARNCQYAQKDFTQHNLLLNDPFINVVDLTVAWFCHTDDDHLTPSAFTDS